MRLQASAAVTKIMTRGVALDRDRLTIGGARGMIL
jgi:hypothetical protein